MKGKTIAVVVLSLAMLMSLFTMGPAPDKTEKLRHDDTSWDSVGQQFVVSMSCKFGIATAGEHAGFTARTTLVINTGGDPETVTGETVIQKADGAQKDADGYIAIEPTYIQWDRGGFAGTASVESSTELVNPSGNVMGDAVTSVTDIIIEPPEPEEPYVVPIVVGRNTYFTLTDPQGRMDPGDDLRLVPPNSGFDSGTVPEDLVISADGTTATARIPQLIAPGEYTIEVREPGASVPLFFPVPVTIT